MIHSRKPKAIAQGRGALPKEPRAHEGWGSQRVSSAYTMQKPVLVLNASYEPINICGARRALILVLKGVAKTEEEQGAILHAALLRIPMPSVIRLLEYRRIPHQTRALSRKNILLRDRNSANTAEWFCLQENLRSTTFCPGRVAASPPGRTGGLLPLLQSQKRQSSAA